MVTGEARDYIDIDTVVASGRFTRGDVLAIGDEQEALPMDRAMLSARFRDVRRWSLEEFQVYEVDEQRRAEIIAHFDEWADDIDPSRRSPGPE